MGYEVAIELRLGGYFPKKVAARPEWIEAPGVVEICSVSECISPGPERWIDHWIHNELGWFDSPQLATRVIPEGAGAFRLFAYRLLLARYREGVEEPWPWPALEPTPLDNTFHRIGFDAVSKSLDSGLGFDCSPLSCCNLAADFGANQYCVLDTLAAAVSAARRFSEEQPEPGPYYVVEVLECRR